MRTTTKDRLDEYHRLREMGFTSEEATALRRISLTLRRWFELECGTENAAGSSISIEREGDDEDGKPFQRIQFMGHGGKWIDRKSPVADRETGARKRLASIMAGHPALLPYVQTDCRGCALYILRAVDLRPGDRVDQVYNRGLAVG